MCVSDETGAGQVRSAKQHRAEVKKTAKDKAVITVSFRKRSKTGLCSICQQVSLMTNDVKTSVGFI